MRSTPYTRRSRDGSIRAFRAGSGRSASRNRFKNGDIVFWMLDGIKVGMFKFKEVVTDEGADFALFHDANYGVPLDQLKSG